MHQVTRSDQGVHRMTSTAWEDFGFAIRKARLDMSWSLFDLAQEALGNPARKGYVSQVERGLRNLSPETIDKFDQALSLPPDIVRAAHLAPPPEKPQPDADKLDQDVERLLTRAENDTQAPQMGETLMVALAYEFAGGKQLDLQTAYIGLRSALEAAERIRQRGEMPPDNTGGQLNAVLAEVAKLNAEGALDEADALLDAEERRMQDTHKSEQDRMAQQATMLLDRRLDQDRLRNDPAAAADRLIGDLMRQAPAGGVFWATHTLLVEWRARGLTQGDPFDLRVALVLANRNLKRANGPQKGSALIDLGNCRMAIGERSADTALLFGAEAAYRAALKTQPKSRNLQNWATCQSGIGIVLSDLARRDGDAKKMRQAIKAHQEDLSVWSREEMPNQWATSQNNLGGALQDLGELEADPKTLRDSADAHRAALTLRSEIKTPKDWAMSQNNLGVSLRWLGALTRDAATLTEAQAAYDACLTIWTRQAEPFRWAMTQWSLGDLALAWFTLDADPARLHPAAAHVTAARAVFAEGSAHQTARCDDLLGKIAQARATLDQA
jgi:hypothetical protein